MKPSLIKLGFFAAFACFLAIGQNAALAATTSSVPTTKQLSNYKIVKVQHINASSPLAKGVTPEWWCGCTFVTNVGFTGTYDYFSFPWVVAARPSQYQQTITYSQNATISGSYNANVSVSAGVVSAGAGWSVTASYGVTLSDAVVVPANTPYTVCLGAEWETMLYSFQVWYNPVIGDNYQLGSGTILRPTGNIYYYTWNTYGSC
jgi:hypothetical protein